MAFDGNNQTQMRSINSIEKRLPWSFLGFVLGTASLAIAIWFFYLAKQEDATDVTFRVVEEFPLVELKEKFPDIKVLYNQDDILESDKEIKIIRLQLANNGRTILQSFYDQKLPFGLSFHNSKVLAVTRVAPLDGYLHDNLFKEETGKDFEVGALLLNKPIIEKGEQISFKVYLLQGRGIEATTITALGKISGLDEISVIPFDPNQSSPTTSGRSAVEIVAIGFASGYFGMLALALTFIPIGLYIEHRENKARKRQCDDFLEENEGLTDEQKRIVQEYGKGWRSYYLPTIRTLLEGGEALDISDLIDALLKRRTRFPFDALSTIRIRRMLPLRWEPAVFTVSEGRIALNETNRDFLVRFLRKCDEIGIEQSHAPEPAGAAVSSGESPPPAR